MATDEQGLRLRMIAQVLEIRRRLGLPWNTYEPYLQQLEFHDAGERYAHRLLRAGNQTGKTWAGTHEVVFHLTGCYPSWWRGLRFSEPVTLWVGGVTGNDVRDITQAYLFGQAGQLADKDREKNADDYTGKVPMEKVHSLRMSRKVADMFDYVRVRHEAGGTSMVRFKSYKEGRESWQGAVVDFIWFDEEPPADIYSEGLTRTINGKEGQRTMMTFTPLKGETEVVRRFMNEDDREAQGRFMVQMTIDDARHITPERRDTIIANWPAHEREARALGIPLLGSGMVFPVPEQQYRFTHMARTPDHWEYLIGLDFGWEHPTAAVLMALDRSADVIYVLRAYKEARKTARQTAQVLTQWGDYPVAWPHDGNARGGGDDSSKMERYAAAGLRMLPEEVRNPVQNRQLQRGMAWGIDEILERMQTGRFVVAAHLSRWFEEARSYHRQDGEIVKEFDDLMSATRYGVMGLMSGWGESQGEVRDSYEREELDRIDRETGRTWSG